MPQNKCPAQVPALHLNIWLSYGGKKVLRVLVQIDAWGSHVDVILKLLP